MTGEWELTNQDKNLVVDIQTKMTPSKIKLRM